MIPYEEALAILYAQEALTPKALPVNEAYGYVAGEDMASDVLIPPLANSAMDGFAVRSADLSKASEKSPVALPVTGSTVAGDTPSGGQGGAWEIMTGAPIPAGYDAVVKVEDVSVDSNEVSFTKPVPVQNNIRNAGEDFVLGSPIITNGTTITPFHVMALATIGKKMIAVRPKPKVTVFSTGRELIEDANAALEPGQIRNSNGPYLMAALEELAIPAGYGGVIHDEPEVFEEKLQQALAGSDIIISTGAVSAGRHDFIPDSLRNLGAEIMFHKVAIRPGKPILYARFEDGTHYFGLPGNPVSAAVGLRFFVIPLLRQLQSIRIEKPTTTRLLMPHPKKQGLRFFYKAYAAINAGGKLHLEILKGQESFKIHPLLSANCWTSLSEAQDGTEIGKPVELYPLMPGRWQLENIA